MPADPQATIVQSCAICGARFQVYASVREALCPTCGATNQIAAPRAVAARPAAARPVQARVPGPGAAPQHSSGRPVVVIQESGGGFMVVVMIALMLAGGYAAYQYRDRIWPKGKKSTAEATPEIVMPAPLDFDRQYRVARMKLLDADKESAQEAAKTFRQLDGPGVLQPMRNWVTFHAGLANLLAGDNDAAVERFTKLAERSSAKETQDAKLAAFFTRCTEVVTKNDVIPVTAGADFDRKNFESIGLFAYGLKNWVLGKFDEAGAMFAEFEKARPEGEDEWVDDYRAVAADLVSDRGHYLSAKQAYDEAKAAPDKMNVSVLAIKEARLRLRGKLFTAEVAQWEKEFADALEAKVAAEAKMMAEREAAEKSLIEELQTKTEALAKEYRFAGAVALAAQAKFTADGRKEQHKLVLRRMNSLVRFQRNLAADLAAQGHRAGVTRADGKVVPGDVRTATEVGVGAVPWKEVSLDWLTKVAAGFIAGTARLDYKSDRQFDLGVLLLLHGKTKEADQWITLAGDTKYEYKDAGMMLFPLPPEPAAK